MKNTIEETQKCKAIVEGFIADKDGDKEHDIWSVKDFVKKFDYDTPLEYAVFCMIRSEMYLEYCEALEEMENENYQTTAP